MTCNIQCSGGCVKRIQDIDDSTRDRSGAEDGIQIVLVDPDIEFGITLGHAGRTHRLLPVGQKNIQIVDIDGSCVWLRAEHKDHVWSYDFVHTKTHDDRSFRMLTLIDEFTRECLAIDVARKLNHDDVLERLAWLMATRGVPDYIRSDNGSEFTAHAVRDWLKHVGAKTLYITPRSPWENAYIESFNRKLASELLEREMFDTLYEAKVLIERWRVHYNTVRPHSLLGYRPRESPISAHPANFDVPPTNLHRAANHRLRPTSCLVLQLLISPY